MSTSMPTACAAARDLESAVMRGDELGVLHGVPYSIKDLTPVAGLPLTLGLAPLRDPEFGVHGRRWRTSARSSCPCSSATSSRCSS
jgi:hypothetical protein